MVINTRRLNWRSVTTSTLLVTNIVLIAGLLAWIGSPEVALTCYVFGVAITLLLALTAAQTWPWPGREESRPIRHCPVCDHRLWRNGKYCSECGSLV